MKNNDGPRRALIFGQSFFDDGPDALEKIRAKRGFGAGGCGGMGNYRLSVGGGDILLNRNRVAGFESAVDAVGELAIVGITVVSVDHRPVVVEKVEILGGECGRKEKKKDWPQMNANQRK
jgi:hypothetical protein